MKPWIADIKRARSDYTFGDAPVSSVTRRAFDSLIQMVVPGELGCVTMQEGVVFSFAFFAAGILMALAGLKLLPHVFYLHHLITAIGFLLLLFALVILVSTFLRSVLPGARAAMKDRCES
ncbi:MAG: hypothetical protein H6981_02305 [Gammaproteobacteria bacterium]|nr:hypothetical protein [Gammaproteobacteria bacterium]